MNINDASSGINSFSNILNSFTGWLSKIVTWMFTFKNILFFLIIIGIIFITWKLFENDVKRKKYNYNRQREI